MTTSPTPAEAHLNDAEARQTADPLWSEPIAAADAAIASGDADAFVAAMHSTDEETPEQRALALVSTLDRMLPVDLDGRLDVDRMRAQAPLLRQALVEHLRQQATALRANRGTVVVPEDTYDLVRRLTAAEEVLRSWGQAFTRAADEAVAIAEEEALTALGEYPGVDGAPSGSLFVPDGEGQRIKVEPQWKSGESVWDVPTLAMWLIDEEVAEVKGERRAEARRSYEARQAAADPNAEGIEPEPLDPVAAAAELAWYESDARHIAGQVVSRLLALGKFTPGAKALEDLRKRLAGQQRDTDAATIRQVRSVGPRKYVGVKVTREEAK